MSLLNDVDSILRSSGYRVLRNQSTHIPLSFEDHSLLGFVAEYENVYHLNKEWKRAEEIFLTRNSRSLRSASQKAWNCYSIHLTTEFCSIDEMADLLTIEEDFASTRKIARGRIVSPRDLTQALAPLLSIQNGMGIQMIDTQPDPTDRFREWPKAAREALAGDASVAEVFSLLLRSK
jgi:hypothetical protein